MEHLVDKDLDKKYYINPLNVQLNPICHLLALLGAHPILHVSRIRVNINIKPKKEVETEYVA